MYSRQNAHFDRLIECGMSTEVVQVFRDIFANPNVELHHEGVITLTGSVVSPQMQASRWAVAQQARHIGTVSGPTAGSEKPSAQKQRTEWVTRCAIGAACLGLARTADATHDDRLALENRVEREALFFQRAA